MNSTFAYNGLDTRVTKNAQSFLRDGAYVTDPVLRDGQASFTPGISERRGATTTFLHSGLKNADAQSSIAQTLTATKQYDAFGNLASSSGTWQGPFGYAGGFGYQTESDSGLMLLGHRYMDPSTGRFLTRDPIKDGRNWYGYVENNPVAAVDLQGLDKKTVLYMLIDKLGNMLKWGITKNPDRRYSKPHLEKYEAKMEVIAEYDSRRHALDDERYMVERDPGPMNKEPWRGKKQGLWDTIVEGVKGFIGFVDPTPIGVGIALGESAGPAIDPWAQTQVKNRKMHHREHGDKEAWE